MSLLAEVQFGREICGELEIAEAREWLVTNGLGGYASGTVAGTTTRRYHGLLVAALQPPVKRTVLVNALDETVRYRGTSFSLATNRWKSGFVSPSGYLQIESFHLEGSKPVWRYALEDALLEKRVWMKQGENTTYIRYSLVRGGPVVDVDAKALVNYRDFHLTTRAPNWQTRDRAGGTWLACGRLRGRVAVLSEECGGDVGRARGMVPGLFSPDGAETRAG